jgi:hypothetical protein
MRATLRDILLTCPELSNRTIAYDTGAHRTIVQAVRAELEAAGRIQPRPNNGKQAPWRPGVQDTGPRSRLRVVPDVGESPSDTPHGPEIDLAEVPHQVKSDLRVIVGQEPRRQPPAHDPEGDRWMCRACYHVQARPGQARCEQCGWANGQPYACL